MEWVWRCSSQCPPEGAIRPITRETVPSQPVTSRTLPFTGAHCVWRGKNKQKKTWCVKVRFHISDLRQFLRSTRIFPGMKISVKIALLFTINSISDETIMTVLTFNHPQTLIKIISRWEYLLDSNKHCQEVHYCNLQLYTAYIGSNNMTLHNIAEHDSIWQK